jgi:nitrate/TMAO reductase-like tetraheme cytochrome c subunit
MSLADEKWIRTLTLQVLLLILALAGTLAMLAESAAAEDLSDNEVCLDCHIDEEQIDALDVSGAQVHNPADSTLIEAAHNEVACIDCHADIREIPHRDATGRTVDCLACHDKTPE